MNALLIALLVLTRPVSPVSFFQALSDAGIAIIDPAVRYDAAYVSILYPNGDVAPGHGVCTDVIIRAYRRLGIDLQREIHEDMVAHFDQYPALWGLKKPDSNIDHRRVQNLQTFFTHRHASLPVSQRATDYQPGDIVTWDLGHGLVHIGLVVDRPSSTDSHRHLIVHNIGNGQVLADCLFDFKITGHYRYQGRNSYL